MITYARRRHAVDLDDLRLQHEQAKKDETMKKGAFGLTLMMTIRRFTWCKP